MILGLADMDIYEKKIKTINLKYDSQKIIIDLNLSLTNIHSFINKFYKNNFISICGTSLHKIYKIKNHLKKIHILVLNKQESLNLTKKNSIKKALNYLIYKKNLDKSQELV